jgi:hypothetical protein
MKYASCLILPALLGLAAASPAQAKIERLVEKTFTVQPGGTLHVETHGGEIRLEPSPDLVVHVTARERIRTDSEADADNLLRKLTLTLEQQGNDVNAIARYEDLTPGFHFGSWPPVQVDFIVQVPASFAADLRTSGGNIAVGDLAGVIDARTSGGNIALGRIGSDVRAATSGGNVSLREGRATVDLRTSGGSISVGRAVGPAELRTSGGSIRIDSAEGTLQAETSGGSVQANLSGAIKGNCDLRTSGGSVHVTVSHTAGFELDAATSGGSVDADGLTITMARGGLRRTALAGTVNGGGPELKLHTSGGSIEVRTI